MAKTALAPYSKPRPKRAPMRVAAPAQSSASVATRDRTAEELRACRARLARIQTTWTMLSPLLPASLQDNRVFRAHSDAVMRRSMSGIGSVEIASSMSPTMWGLLGLVVGIGGTWAWLTLR